ncbi:MAG: hypothetical protein WBZ01_18630, partial [Terriglobales bacterium]
GTLLEDSFDVPDVSVETEQAINRAEAEIARLGPAINEKVEQQESCRKDLEKELQESRRKLQDEQRKMQERQRMLRRELSGAWAEI